jgi:chromosome segregation ATPase
MITARFSLIFTICIFSCSSMTKSKCLELNDNLTSENILMKKKITLMEREGGVLKEENLLYKRDLQQRMAEVEHLVNEIKSLKQKYDNDTALWNSRYLNIVEKNKILEKESSEKIKELSELNRQLEARLGEEIRRLTGEMAVREKGHATEMEQIKSQFAAREFTLLKEIEEFKKQISTRDAEIASLKSKNSEQSLAIAVSKEKIDELNKLLTKLDIDFKTLQNRMAEFEKAREADKEKIKQLEKKDVKVENQAEKIPPKS